jgi:predicted dehydrogenase
VAAAAGWPRLADHVREHGEALRAVVDAGPAARAPARPRRGAFAGRWPGPFNYRALLADLTSGDRDAAIALFGADKRSYAVLTHLAMLADVSGTRDEAIDAASLALRFPIDAAVGAQLWSALLASGWVCPTS